MEESQGQGAIRQPAPKRKVTVTIPTELLLAAAARVRTGRARSLSAYLSAALAERVAGDQERDGYLEWLKKLDEELGPPSPEAYVWARQVLGL